MFFHFNLKKFKKKIKSGLKNINQVIKNDSKLKKKFNKKQTEDEKKKFYEKMKIESLKDIIKNIQNQQMTIFNLKDYDQLEDFKISAFKIVLNSWELFLGFDNGKVGRFWVDWC